MKEELIWKGSSGYTPGIGYTEAGKSIFVSSELAEKLKAAKLAVPTKAVPAKTTQKDEPKE